MKTHFRNQLVALAAGLSLLVAGRLPAQTLTTLHDFSATSLNANGASTNTDGANPFKELVLFGHTLYGTATGGGSGGNGSLFKINTDGTGFTPLYDFSATATNSGGFYTNSDGANPFARLVLSGSTFYGTTSAGGNSGNGTVFKINTDGTGFTNLYSFTAFDALTGTTNSDGAGPVAGLVLSGNTLYGTAQAGGSSGSGSVFAIHTDGTGFTNLYSFSATDANGFNSDGANSHAELFLSGSTLYGTTFNGGSSGNGTVFALQTNGTGFTVLYSFSATDVNGFNSDGANPYNGVILSGNTLYGAAYNGGSSGNGTVFEVGTNGTGFAVLYGFTATDTSGFNSDGANPYAVTLVGSTIFGTADTGGSSGNGTVFQLNTDGTGFTNLFNFDGSDGATPNGVIYSGNTLYGTTLNGGAATDGTVFALALAGGAVSPTIVSPVYFAPGQFQMTVNGVAGQNYTVQMSTNLASTNWTSLLVTNPSSSTFLFSDPNATNKQRFYRVWVGP